ncbi:MAG TPA: transposase [Ktedonobacterales bacterium]
MRLTRAVTHIRLCDANHAKIEALDQLSAEYVRLCQQYTTYFCTEAEPDGYLAPCFESPLSQRWQRVAIQHAAGIAQSWRSNYAAAYQDYLGLCQEYQEEPEADPPIWKEWNPPVLKEPVIQANANVVLLQPSEDSSFDYWLRISTLEKGRPVLLPVKLATYHQQALAGKTLNSSTVLARKADGWWLTLSYDEQVNIEIPQDAPVIGIDVGIANFITTSTGKHYGSFNGKLAERHRRDRQKRRRKAKLRACLKKKGIKRLPSTRNKKLARHVRQEINRAVNELYRDYPDAQFAYEQLNVAGMKFKARRMNAYLYASNLAHIPAQLVWGAARRGIRAHKVKSAYSSQECHRCHYVARENRPNQQTFCCVVCGHTTHADVNAAENLAGRLNDQELTACVDLKAIKALLERRHQDWQSIQRLAVVQPPAQLFVNGRR